MKIATSILNAKNRLECIKKLNNTQTDYIHIDTMDGHFVPNYQLPIEEVNNLEKISTKPFDVHLMVDNPIPYINDLDYDKIKCLTFHIEVTEDIHSIINLIKEHHIEVGLAIKPKTDINLLKEYINEIDKVLVMSVEPGFGGQPFIETTPNRISKIKNLKKDIIIEVDGGINNETIKKIDSANIAVVGSYITNNDNYEKAINNLKN